MRKDDLPINLSLLASLILVSLFIILGKNAFAFLAIIEMQCAIFFELLEVKKDMKINEDSSKS